MSSDEFPAPDEFPDNVIPLRPRRPSGAGESRKGQADRKMASSTAMPGPAKRHQTGPLARTETGGEAKLYPISEHLRRTATPQTNSAGLQTKPGSALNQSRLARNNGGGDAVSTPKVPSAIPPRAKAAVATAGPGRAQAATVASRPAGLGAMASGKAGSVMAAKSQASKIIPGSEDVAHAEAASTEAAKPTITPAETKPAAGAAPIEPTPEQTTAIQTMPTETRRAETKRAEPPAPPASAPAAKLPQPPAPFTWRRVALILGSSFALGIAIAWGAIAVGAHVVGTFPHGFAYYAMLIGGGLTMLLTAALMTAVFYSDSSGYDERVHELHPNERMRSNGEKRDGEA